MLWGQWQSASCHKVLHLSQYGTWKIYYLMRSSKDHHKTWIAMLVKLKRRTRFSGFSTNKLLGQSCNRRLHALRNDGALSFRSMWFTLTHYPTFAGKSKDSRRSFLGKIELFESKNVVCSQTSKKQLIISNLCFTAVSKLLRTCRVPKLAADGR